MKIIKGHYIHELVYVTTWRWAYTLAISNLDDKQCGSPRKVKFIERDLFDLDGKIVESRTNSSINDEVFDRMQATLSSRSRTKSRTIVINQGLLYAMRVKL